MDQRIGIRIRALRHRRAWRQVDLGARAGVSQGVVSLIERGRTDLVSIDRLRRVARELDAEIVIQIRWRAGDLDRLVDEGHATLVAGIAELLKANGWLVVAEVSYSVFGERGSIDILAWHAADRALVVVEVKSDFVSVEETLRKHDEKTRLATRIATEQLGWPRAVSVGRLLVLPDLSTTRRRVGRHESVLTGAYPSRGATVRTWLKAPIGAMSGVLFLGLETGRRQAVGRKRIRSAV